MSDELPPGAGDRLRKYLSFRHRFIHNYGDQLSWGIVRGPLGLLPETVAFLAGRTFGRIGLSGLSQASHSRKTTPRLQDLRRNPGTAQGQGHHPGRFSRRDKVETGVAASTEDSDNAPVREQDDVNWFLYPARQDVSLLA